ncbi:beta-glucoside operon transcriptional antiterminator [Natronobacillus azotifigens]|uniref:PRD domain-containing protein n=1 Tax=Natronobacillus azotifigens TaxID=472978 RepID=A0A9J6R848_9BACI|nr:PRD domain-containing protein [Natronobacillus azotifigens]MCZ0701727.1 PRD domain-containing protein [Natronobacillus azotifigens]
MRIKKILNNNVVVSEDKKYEEIVVMGRGLAFQKKIGDQINVDKVEKTFILEEQDVSDKLGELLKEIPEQHFDIAYKIISFAKERLDYKLDDYIYIALTDHLSFAIGRYNQGINLPNALLWEIKKFYKQEYKIAQASLAIIEEDMNIKLPEDEAASIALHLVNSQLSGENMEATVQMTKMVNSILAIVKYHYQIVLDEDSINYQRFLTHLKFFALRFVRDEGKTKVGVESFLYEQVKEKYKEAFDCSEKIDEFINKTYGWHVSNDEKVFLTLHIQRVATQEKNAEKRMLE